jgi:hypothetical protein
MQLTPLRLASIAVLTATSLTLAACGGGSSPSTGSATKVPDHPSASDAADSGPVCPLTGMPVRKGQNANRVALGVKIDNIAPALPQAGINKADVVVEELVEGGLTRLMAIFQCNSASDVGPIRSARISDADILALLHGSVLGFSGANPKDLPPIEANSGAVLISQDADPQYFHRDYSRPAPHNVFSSTKAMLGAGTSRRHSLRAPKPLFSYGPIDSHTKNAHRVYLSWPAASAQWTWNHGSWLRTQDGVPDKLTDGQQISATNVVIMSVNIASTGLHDVLGNPSPLDVTVGHDTVWVLRGGKIVTGTWRRPTVASKLIFTDAHGHTINLAPGRTWVELLPKPNKPSRH